MALNISGWGRHPACIAISTAVFEIANSPLKN
jgi:hypothetical protein